MKRAKNLTFDGHAFEIIKHDLGKGGQGLVHKARRRDDLTKLAIIKEMQDVNGARRRVEYLIDICLGFDLPLLSAPLAVVNGRKRGQFFYLATFCAGVSVDSDQPRAFPELLEIAATLCHVWSRLEAVGIAHGDIGFSNALIAPDGRPQLIDIDNYRSSDPGVPTPSMYGQHPMIAPEIRAARNAGQSRPPDILSDRFAWGIFLYYLLTGDHPASGLDDTPAAFDHVMLSGNWPGERTDKKVQPAFPVGGLGTDLTGLFKHAFLVDPSARPSAEDWRLGLRRSFDRIHLHSCGNAFIVDEPSGRCPFCKRRYRLPAAPASKVSATPTGQAVLTLTDPASGQSTTIALPDGQYIHIGRENLPIPSAKVSRRHIRVLKQDHTLTLAHIGSNPTTITLPSTGETYKLKSHVIALNPFPLQGAILNLADQAVKVEVTAS